METNSKIKKIIVFSHDAGGAQILSSYLYLKNIKKVFGICEGPAKKIFKEKKIIVKKKSYRNLINSKAKFYTTTSWNSNIEKTAIKSLLLKKQKFVTFIDHWENYKKRFLKNYIPNNIWSFDTKSYKKFKLIFKKKNIFLKKNFFHSYALKKILNYKKPKNYKLNYLYLTEPLSELNKKFYKKKLSYPELKSLEFFLKKIEIKNKNIKITIRVHPNDKISKYMNFQKKFKNLNIRFDNQTSIYKQLAQNFNIVSFKSSIMLLALKNNNNVLSSCPRKLHRVHYLKNKHNYVYNLSKI